MKLLSLNAGLFEKNNTKISQFLTEQSADILCFQEITKSIDRTTAPDEVIKKPSVDSATKQLSYDFFSPNWILSEFTHHHFHGQDKFEYDLGGLVEFGNYTKSRFPIVRAENHYVQNQFTYFTDWSNWPEDDVKSFQVIDLLVNQQPLRVINYHGVWSADKKGTHLTIEACRLLRKYAQAIDTPLIICGDFNLFPDTPSIKLISDVFTSLTDLYQIKTTRPATNELHLAKRNVVDYIFVSDHIKIKDFTVPNSDVSDHLPLILEFEL